LLIRYNLNEIHIIVESNLVIDEVEVTAEVCASYSSSNTCGWSGTVRIRLCNESGSEFFVYLLAVPPGCPLAYCVDAASRKQCTPPLAWLPEDFRCESGISLSKVKKNSLNYFNALINNAPLKQRNYTTVHWIKFILSNF